jgi:hypothetical protein
LRDRGIELLWIFGDDAGNTDTLNDAQNGHHVCRADNDRYANHIHDPTASRGGEAGSNARQAGSCAQAKVTGAVSNRQWFMAARKQVRQIMDA